MDVHDANVRKTRVNYRSKCEVNDKRERFFFAFDVQRELRHSPDIYSLVRTLALHSVLVFFGAPHSGHVSRAGRGRIGRTPVNKQTTIPRFFASRKMKGVSRIVSRGACTLTCFSERHVRAGYLLRFARGGGGGDSRISFTACRILRDDTGGSKKLSTISTQIVYSHS